MANPTTIARFLRVNGVPNLIKIHIFVAVAMVLFYGIIPILDGSNIIGGLRRNVVLYSLLTLGLSTSIYLPKEARRLKIWPIIAIFVFIALSYFSFIMLGALLGKVSFGAVELFLNFVAVVSTTYLLSLAVIISRLKPVPSLYWKFQDIVVLFFAALALAGSIISKVEPNVKLISSAALILASIAAGLQFSKLTYECKSIADGIE